MEDLQIYEEWRLALAKLQGGRTYYRDQTPESIKQLVDLARAYEPNKIIEIGTSYGLSLRAWLHALPEVHVTAIDFTFNPLRMTTDVVPYDESRVTLVESDVSNVELPMYWHGTDKVILFFDCHGAANMRYTLKHAESLPKGSVFAVDDMWYSEEKLHEGNLEEFYDRVVLPTVDPHCPVRPVDYSDYWVGGSFYCFDEVHPLMRYLERNRIVATHEPPKLLYWEV